MQNNFPLGFKALPSTFFDLITSSLRNIDAGEEEEKKLVKIAVQLP